MTTSAQDFQGTPLEIGDKVASTIDGYADLVLLIVVGFTPQKIKVTRDPNNTAGGGYYRRNGEPFLKRPSDVIKAR